MNFDHIDSLPGSPQPRDLFEPHMPGVDLLSDMPGFFAQARTLLASADLSASARLSGLSQLVQDGLPSSGAPAGQRYVAIVTPGRMLSFVPAPAPGAKSEKELAPLKAMLGNDRPLQITAISYTFLKAYLEDKTRTKCIPFLGILLGFAYLGHNVLVFEGHASALQYGVQGSDLLIIDSGMLPFLPEDWASVVFPAIKPGARVLIHERKSFGLTPVTRKSDPPGWQRSEPSGESSYINMLLTTLGKSDYRQDVALRSSEPAPDPRQFTTDPAQLAYLSRLPFQYDKLKVDVIIAALWKLGKPLNTEEPAGPRIFKAKLAASGGSLRDISFLLTLSTTADRKQQLLVRLQ